MSDFGSQFDTPDYSGNAEYPEINNYYSATDFVESIPETVSPELSYYSNEGRNYPTESPAIQSVSVPDGGSFADLAGSVTREFDGLVKLYGNVMSIESARENVALNRELGRNRMEIAKIKSNGEVRVITAQQKGAVVKAERVAEEAKRGSILPGNSDDVNWPVIIGIAGLGIAIYYGKKVKK